MLTTKPPPTAYQRLPRVNMNSPRKEMIFGEALTALSSRLEASLKRGDKYSKVEWGYIAPKEIWGSIEFDVDRSKITYLDLDGKIGITGVTPQIITSVAQSAGLAAKPISFKSYGCQVEILP